MSDLRILNLNTLSDKLLSSGRMDDELAHQAIRTFDKANVHEHVERMLGMRMFVGLRERESRSNPSLSRNVEA